MLSGLPIWWDRRTLDGSRFCEAFWHLITKGDRSTRIPDFARARRLSWCRAIIDNAASKEVLVFAEPVDARTERHYLWLDAADHIVILEKTERTRGPVFVLLTAYCIEGESSRRKFRRKYEKLTAP